MPTAARESMAVSLDLTKTAIMVEDTINNRIISSNNPGFEKPTFSTPGQV
jgi:hypothetical protein